MMVMVVFMSTMLAVSSSCWMVVWIFMEINTMSMTMIMEKKKKVMSSKNLPSLSYFMIQCLTSITLLTTILMQLKSEELKMTVCVFLLLVKMGVWPFHMWYLKVLMMLKMKEKSFMLLTTWQKTLPLLLMAHMVEIKMNPLMWTLVINMVVMSMMLKKKSTMKWMMAVSSSFNSSWMILSSASTTTMVMFLMIYSSSMIMALKIMKESLKKNLKPISNMISPALVMCNLGGLPPSMMFFSKVMLMKTLINKGMMEMTMLMLVLSCIFLYNYLLSMVSMFLSVEKKSQMLKMTEKKSAIMILMMSLMASMFSLLLGLTNEGIILMG